MAKTTRDIGPIGTGARVVTGLALLYIAGDGSVAPPREASSPRTR